MFVGGISRPDIKIIRTEALVMARKELRRMSLGELMSWLGNAHPGSVERPAIEAEYERRKFVWQRIAVMVAGIGVVVGFLGVLVGAAHLGVFK